MPSCPGGCYTGGADVGAKSQEVHIVVQWFLSSAPISRTTPVTRFGVGMFSQHTLSNRQL